MGSFKQFKPSLRCNLVLWSNVAVSFALPFCIRYGWGTVWPWLCILLLLAVYIRFSSLLAQERKAWHDALMTNSPIPAAYLRRLRAKRGTKDKADTLTLREPS